MVGFALGFLKSYWKYIAIVAVVLSVAYAINVMVQKYNTAIETAIEEKNRADKWQRSSEGWKSSFGQSESKREQEARQAISSTDRERIACNTRVANAFRSNERINTLTRITPNAVTPASPDLGVITTDELRDALRAQ